MAAKDSTKGTGAKSAHRSAQRRGAPDVKEDTLARQMRSIEFTNGEVIWPDDPDAAADLTALMASLGTSDPVFFQGLLGQLIGAGPTGSEFDQKSFSFMLSLIKGIKPKDPVEAMLAAQMASVHVTTMKFARHVANAQDVVQLDITERTFNKLARTFVAQVDALKRYRSGGEQTVTVQHVNISEGGQAIVGNVTQGQADAAPKRATRLAIADAKTAPMPIIEAVDPAKVPNRRTHKNDRRSST